MLDKERSTKNCCLRMSSNFCFRLSRNCVDFETLFKCSMFRLTSVPSKNYHNFPKNYRKKSKIKKDQCEVLILL